MWVVTYCPYAQYLNYYYISIHTTHVGGDISNAYRLKTGMAISIHTTHVGGDPLMEVVETTDRDFNPHHPCGWWQVKQMFVFNFEEISIHTTHVGGDFWVKITKLFQISISIHTTHVGGDHLFR